MAYGVIGTIDFEGTSFPKPMYIPRCIGKDSELELREEVVGLFELGEDHTPQEFCQRIEQAVRDGDIEGGPGMLSAIEEWCEDITDDDLPHGGVDYLGVSEFPDLK